MQELLDLGADVTKRDRKTNRLAIEWAVEATSTTGGSSEADGVTNSVPGEVELTMDLNRPLGLSFVNDDTGAPIQYDTIQYRAPMVETVTPEAQFSTDGTQGIGPGDYLVEAGGMAVQSLEQFQKIVWSRKTAGLESLHLIFRKAKAGPCL